MKTIQQLLLLAIALLVSCSGGQSKKKEANSSPDKLIVAYVTSWSHIMPDPMYMTHINYAFGHVNETFNGVRIDNEERLRQITALKEQKPELKVMLSIGGWGSGRFSEMAADSSYREQFAGDCERVIETFNLDGIDIDWEYPTSGMANISSSPDDTRNFTFLMRDLRKAIGENKLLTLASAASADYIDFKSIEPYIDFVNIMTYDMANAPLHHSALYSSGNAGELTSDKAVKAHLAAGIPPHKLTMGMPFYGRGGKHLSNTSYRKMEELEGFFENWDDTAKVPYLTNKDSIFVLGYENPRSLAIKCQYILDNDLSGGMYWEYNGDNEQGDLRRTVYECLVKNR